MSSADWMNRNMMRRIEIAWPIEDPVLRQRVIDECLLAYEYDTQDAWQLDSKGHYSKVSDKHDGVTHSAQSALMVKYREKKQ